MAHLATGNRLLNGRHGTVSRMSAYSGRLAGTGLSGVGPISDLQTLPDCMESSFVAALCNGAIGGLLKSWVRNCLKEGYSVDVVLIITRRGAPSGS